MSHFSRKKIGLEGELLIEQYLTQNGYTIIKKNFSIRGGEVDIIAIKKEVLAFTEVKTRENIYFNTSEVVNYSKQKKIITTAKVFLSQNNNYSDKVLRFDIALVEGSNKKVTYIENAFTDTNDSY